MLVCLHACLPALNSFSYSLIHLFIYFKHYFIINSFHWRLTHHFIFLSGRKQALLGCCMCGIFWMLENHQKKHMPQNEFEIAHSIHTCCSFVCSYSKVLLLLNWTEFFKIISLKTMNVKMIWAGIARKFHLCIYTPFIC